VPSGPNHIVEVKAPIAGIFYRAASPEDPPYIEIGSTVSPKQVLCLLETMKVFTKVRSVVPGKVVEILVQNGETVGKGQTMVLIEHA